MKIFKKILIVILTLSLFGGVAAIGYNLSNLNHINFSISQKNSDLGIENESLKNIQEIMSLGNYKENEILNIALFGVDTRNINGNDNTRSDSIIIATVDKKHSKIKLSSIMRDTYVNIDGHGRDKINHAYAFGGPQLAIKTLNQNLGLDVKNFVTVNFFGLEKIIDTLGGIKVTVKPNEVNELNKFIKEVARIEGKIPTLITSSGTQTLNGMQAVSYGRIRKVGNGDYERTDRQREIIISILNKIKSSNPADVLKLISESIPYVKTNLSLSTITSLATSVLKDFNNYEIQQERFPKDGEGKIINKVWYMVADIDKTKSDIQKFIYEIN